MTRLLKPIVFLFLFVLPFTGTCSSLHVRPFVENDLEGSTAKRTSRFGIFRTPRGNHRAFYDAFCDAIMPEVFFGSRTITDDDNQVIGIFSYQHDLEHNLAVVTEVEIRNPEQEKSCLRTINTFFEQGSYVDFFYLGEFQRVPRRARTPRLYWSNLQAAEDFAVGVGANSVFFLPRTCFCLIKPDSSGSEFSPFTLDLAERLFSFYHLIFSPPGEILLGVRRRRLKASL